MKFRLLSSPRATGRALLRNVFNAIGKAAAMAADDAAKIGRSQVQGAMRANKLGRLAGSVRYSSDMKKRRTPRTTAAGAPIMPFRAGAIVFTTGGSDRTSGAFDAYSNGANIRPTGGRQWLAFPTKSIPKRVGRFKMTPALYNAGGFDKKIGPLQFIKGISAGVAYLIVKNVGVNKRDGGSARRLPLRGGLGASRKISEFTVAFILIRATRRAQRFNPVAIIFKQAAMTPSRIAAYLNGGGGSVKGPVLFASSGRATAQFIKPFTQG